MRLNLPMVAHKCDRYGMLNRSAAAAAVSFTLLKDLQIALKTEKETIIDRIKIIRERDKHRKSLKTEKYKKKLNRFTLMIKKIKRKFR